MNLIAFLCLCLALIVLIGFLTIWEIAAAEEEREREAKMAEADLIREWLDRQR